LNAHWQFKETDMQANSKALVELETKFWQSLVDEDTDTALSMLDEPALMVSTHGAMQFDHRQYRQMAEQGTMVVKSFELSDMNVVFPTDETAVMTYRVKQALAPRGKSDLINQEMADSSVWTRKDGEWRCVMHTETPVGAGPH
jgi:hypothetical protein